MPRKWVQLREPLTGGKIINSALVRPINGRNPLSKWIGAPSFSRHLQSRIGLCSILRCFQGSSIHRRSAQMWVWHCWPKPRTHGLTSLMFTWSNTIWVKQPAQPHPKSQQQNCKKKIRPTNQQTYSRAISKAFVMMVFTPQPRWMAAIQKRHILTPPFEVLALQDFWFELCHRITWQVISIYKSWNKQSSSLPCNHGVSPIQHRIFKNPQHFWWFLAAWWVNHPVIAVLVGVETLSANILTDFKSW